MAAPGWGAAFSRSRPSLALGVSIVLHATVAFAVSRVPWSAPAPEAGRPIAVHLVFLNERLPPEPPGELVPEPPPFDAPRETIPPEPEPLPEDEPIEAEVVSPPEPVPPPEPPADRTPPERQAESLEGGSPAEAREGERPRRNYLAPGVDWEEERRRAVARALEDLQREQPTTTFSNDPFGGEEQTAEAANPREDLFSGGSPGGRAANRQGLQPGRSRSAFLNRVAEICNALTGGFGVGFQGIFVGSLCTEPGPTADFFADLRPDYMNSLPECAETDELELSPLAIERRDEIPTIKCRLVMQEP